MPAQPDTIHNIYCGNGKGIRKGADGRRVAVGKERFYFLAYADDIALMATREEELRRIIKRLERYLDKKSLLRTLNTDKSKIMVLGK